MDIDPIIKMDNCCYCGEYKKVRRMQGVLDRNLECNFFYTYNYICEDCDKALDISEESELIKKKKKWKKTQRGWIKKRDKILGIKK